jgi:hypothetical protein
MLYRDIINKDKKFKFDTSRPVKSLENLFAIIIDSLTKVYFAKHIDNLLVQLSGLTSNEIKTLISYSISYYYYMFNILFQQIDDLFILSFRKDY